jgi:cytochrome c oxidase cbb3-type subunit 3
VTNPHKRGEAPLFHHVYDDDIQEQDNPVPPWLTAIFAACIAFAPAYVIYYHLSGRGTTIQEDFQVAWAAHQKVREAARASEQVDVTEAMLSEGATQPAQVAHGKEIFLARCVGCHTDNGRGLVGPNLTDNYQLHGTTRLDIYNTINTGVLDKGMAAWGETLSADDVVSVATFVTTLRGTNVPNGKAPQGVQVGAFPQ